MARSRKNRTPQEPVTANVTSLSHEGRGICKIDGKSHFVFNALPEETVEFKITSSRRNYCEGETLNVITPSAKRIEPKCKFFGLCGGCSLQHMSHEDQVSHKQQSVLEMIEHAATTTPKHILSPIIASPWGYRNRARLGVRYVNKKEKLLMGFRERAGRYLAEMDRCEILHPSVGHHFPEIIDLIASLSCYQEIPQVEVAIGDDQTALIIRHLSSLNTDDETKLLDFAKKQDYQIFTQPNKPLPIKKIWPDDNNHFLRYSLPDLNISYRFKISDFTQINPAINQQIINTALSLLDPQPNETVLDLFCGLGNFTLPLAQRCLSVVGVEGSDDMVARGYENSKLNNINNTSFYAADLFKPTTNAEWSTAKYDKILLDPPRSGAQEILEDINKLEAKQILYISCNPATLARDTEILVKHGYTLDTFGVADMFPHTTHIESIALFTKQ